jgi:hypothetical protein
VTRRLALGRLLATVFAVVGLIAMARAAEPASAAQEWNGLSVEAQFFYLRGFRDGLVQGWVFSSKKLKAGDHAPTAIREFLEFDEAAIGPVMDDLYRDPSNAYLSFSSVALIARAKLAGENVDERLRLARKATHQLKLSNEQKK